MNICVFGDSNAWGAYDPEIGGWVDRLKIDLAGSSDYETMVYNLGISGDTTDGLLVRFDVEAKARDPHVIIFDIGGNDASYISSEDNLLVPLSKFKDNIKKLISLARSYTNKIIFISLGFVDESKSAPVPWDPKFFSTNKFFKIYDAALKEILISENIPLLDRDSFLKVSNLDEDDGLHWNEEGHRKTFELVRGLLSEKNFL